MLKKAFLQHLSAAARKIGSALGCELRHEKPPPVG